MDVVDGEQPVIQNVYDAEIRGAEMGIGGPSAVTFISSLPLATILIHERRRPR